MADEKERAINPIYIESFNEHDFVCEYNPILGRCKERLRDEISGKELVKGYYTKADDLILGIFATNKGPVFFGNDRQFLLEPGSYHMDADEKVDKKIFCLTIDGQREFQIEYEKPRYVDYDVWSDEETVDFFLWLAKKNKDKFHEYYTLNDIEC